MVVSRVGQNLKDLAGLNHGGARADRSDYAVNFRRREAKFRPQEDRLIFSEKKRRHEKLHTALSGEIQ